MKHGDMVRTLAEILNDTNLTEIEYATDDCKIKVARQSPPPSPMVLPSMMPTMPAPQAGTSVLTEVAASGEAKPAPSVDPGAHPGTIKAPMVGTAYMAPSPEAESFVRVGQRVEKGDTLMIIEAMKVMNQIKASNAGTISQILCKDGDPLEFDQPLMIIEYGA